MANGPGGSGVVRCGGVQLDVRSGEVRTPDSHVVLQDQPLRILIRLLHAPGQVVTRDELRRELWPEDTFVDFEHGLNAAIKRLRDALHDSADAPRFIETLPRRGYRFIAASRRIEWLAVLPLDNLSGDPRQDYFADGLTESLITELARLSGLKGVIARGSVMRYKGTSQPPAEIARELGVDALITGAVLRSEDRVRVTAQLIAPQTGEQLWTEQYDRAITDVLRLQNEVTRAIANEIRVRLTPNEQARLARARSVNPEAYDAYLMGRFHWFKMSPHALDRAVEYFQLALDHDPNDALAHLGIGYVWAIRAHTGVVPPVDGYVRARAAAVKGLELDATLPEAHDLMAALVTWYEWDWAAGERAYRRAIELNANYPDVRAFYSFFLHAMQRPEEARTQIERAIELDPYNSFLHRGLAMELLNEHRPDEAFVHLQRAATLQPDSLFVHFSLWSAFNLQREYEKALAEAKEYFALLRAREVVQALDHGYAQDGYRGAMREAADTLAAMSARISVNPCDVARLYALVDEHDRALDWLENAFRDRSTRLPYLNVMWEFDGLRSHSRFQELLRRMNLRDAPCIDRRGRDGDVG
jgi:TolB-like protein/Tfp pilus assembly protein PilF